MALLLACCGSPSAFDTLSDDALCGTGPIDPAAILLPRPKLVRRLEPPSRLTSQEVSLSGALPLPSLGVLMDELGLRPGNGGLRLEALDAEGLEEVIERCDLDPPSSPEAYFLATTDGPDGPVAVLAANDERGGSRATALLSSILAAGFRDAVVYDAPTQPLRGILEGFYGPPWTADERLEMIRFAWRTRMNTYVWSPKDELGSRLLWRFGYGDEELASLASMTELGERLGIEVCALLSPGIGVAYSSQGDRELVFQKLELFTSLGARCVGLAFDDIDRSLRDEDQVRYGGELARAQVDLANDVASRIHAASPEVRFGFVPTDYSSSAMMANPEYSSVIAATLSPKSFVGWTGPEIVSSSIVGDDLSWATQHLARAPVVGDNYPVVDGGRKGGALQLGAVERRDALAVSQAAGWISNGMPLPLASRFALASVAELTWNPESYQPLDSEARAFSFLEPHDAADLELLRDTSAPGLFARPSRLEAQVTEYLESYPAPHAELTRTLSRLASLPARMATGKLAKELRPWLELLAAYGDLGLRLMGKAPASESDADLGREARLLEASNVRVSDQLPRLIDELLRLR